MFVGGPNERLDYHLEHGEEVQFPLLNQHFRSILDSHVDEISAETGGLNRENGGGDHYMGVATIDRWERTPHQRPRLF